MSPRKGKGGGQRRGGSRGRRGGWRGRLAGMAILAGGAALVWFGSGLVDEGGDFLPRALERDGGAGGMQAEPPPVERPIPAPWSRVRVEVLNAGGVRGMAAEARDELRDAGFDVVHYGNASAFDADRSEVILRGGGEGAAREVAAALGIDRILVEPDSTLLVEVTVRLGSDWLNRGAREARAREMEGVRP